MSARVWALSRDEGLPIGYALTRLGLEDEVKQAKVNPNFANNKFSVLTAPPRVVEPGPPISSLGQSRNAATMKKVCVS